MQNPLSEHIVLSFAECIISCFDVFVHDVVKKFAKRLRLEEVRKQIWYENESVIDDFLQTLAKFVKNLDLSKLLC